MRVGVQQVGGDTRVGGQKADLTGDATVTATASAEIYGFHVSIGGTATGSVSPTGSVSTTVGLDGDVIASTATASGGLLSTATMNAVAADATASLSVTSDVSTRAYLGGDETVSLALDEARLSSISLRLDGDGRATGSAESLPMYTRGGLSGETSFEAETTGGFSGMSIWTAGHATAPGLAGSAFLPEPTFASLNPGLVRTVSPPGGPLEDEQDRIRDYIKSPFADLEDDDFGTLVTLAGEMFTGLTVIRNNILRSRYVDYARGKNLDEIGTLVFTPRRTNESDAHYRVRLKATFARYVGGATIDEIRETVALLLGSEVGAIELTEPFDFEPAIFNLQIDPQVLDNSEVSLDDLLEFVYLFKAGGVKVNISVYGLFRHRSLSQLRQGVTDVSHAYNRAGYAGRLFAERAYITEARS